MSLLKKPAVKRYLVERVKIVHPAGAKFTRVSAQAYDDLEYRLRQVIDGYLKAQRVGKTITTP